MEIGSIWHRSPENCHNPETGLIVSFRIVHKINVEHQVTAFWRNSSTVKANPAACGDVHQTCNQFVSATWNLWKNYIPYFSHELYVEQPYLSNVGRVLVFSIATTYHGFSLSFDPLGLDGTTFDQCSYLSGEMQYPPYKCFKDCAWCSKFFNMASWLLATFATHGNVRAILKIFQGKYS